MVRPPAAGPRSSRRTPSCSPRTARTPRCHLARHARPQAAQTTPLARDIDAPHGGVDATAIGVFDTRLFDTRLFLVQHGADPRLYLLEQP